MKIRLLSDLHLEFCPKDAISRRIDELTSHNAADPADVLVLAGDIATTDIDWVLLDFAARFERVLFIPGNHEYYGASPEVVQERLRRAQRESLTILSAESGPVEIQGRRFLGDTLWFPDLGSDEGKWALSDFYQIHGFEPWVYDRNRLATEMLESQVRPGDVVTTHHLPSERCVHEKYQGSPLNKFFVSDLTPLIEKAKPALWLFGHTHESVDLKIGETRLVCNPFGYAGHEENASFDPGLTIEI